MIPRHFQITLAVLLFAILLAGMYMARLKRTEDAMSLQHPSASPAALPSTGSQETIRVLVAYDDDMALRWRDVQVVLPVEPGARARAALHALLAQYLQTPSPHAIGNGSEIRNVYLLADGTAVIDTTPQFANGHPSGILLEELTITSMVETLAVNVPSITKVKFLVDGQERETLAGHADLLATYPIAAVNELAREFE